MGTLAHVFTLAGMPVPIWVLTEIAEQRIEAISFFLLVILLSGWAVQGLWNRAGVEAFGWPRIGYRRALAVVALWGCGAVLVLTMISGARELLTPGAWNQDGATYALDEQPPGPTPVDIALDVARSNRLEAIWRLLREQRDENGFPKRSELTGIDWSVPGRPGVEYLYRGPLAGADGVLVIEPRVFGDEQLVLRADGRVERMTSTDLGLELAREQTE